MQILKLYSLFLLAVLLVGCSQKQLKLKQREDNLYLSKVIKDDSFLGGGFFEFDRPLYQPILYQIDDKNFFIQLFTDSHGYNLQKGIMLDLKENSLSLEDLYSYKSTRKVFFKKQKSGIKTIFEIISVDKLPYIYLYWKPLRITLSKGISRVEVDFIAINSLVNSSSKEYLSFLDHAKELLPAQEFKKLFKAQPNRVEKKLSNVKKLKSSLPDIYTLNLTVTSFSTMEQFLQQHPYLSIEGIKLVLFIGKKRLKNIDEINQFKEKYKQYLSKKDLKYLKRKAEKFKFKEEEKCYIDFIHHLNRRDYITAQKIKDKYFSKYPNGKYIESFNRDSKYLSSKVAEQRQEIKRKEALENIFKPYLLKNCIHLIWDGEYQNNIPIGEGYLECAVYFGSRAHTFYRIKTNVTNGKFTSGEVFANISDGTFFGYRTSKYSASFNNPEEIKQLQIVLDKKATPEWNRYQEEISRPKAKTGCDRMYDKCTSYCEIKSNKSKGFLSDSDKDSCISSCHYAKLRCQNNDIEDAKQNSCMGICQGVDKTNGGLFKSSSYENCYFNCLREFSW